MLYEKGIVNSSLHKKGRSIRIRIETNERNLSKRDSNEDKKGRSIRIRIETGKRENGISNSRQ